MTAVSQRPKTTKTCNERIYSIDQTFRVSRPFLSFLVWWEKRANHLVNIVKKLPSAHIHTPPRACVCALRDRLCLMTTYTQKNILPLSSSLFCYQSTWWVCIISWRLKGGFISKLFIADSTSEIWIHKNQCNYHQEEEEEEEFGADHFGLLPSRKMWNDIFMYVQLLFICLYGMDLSEDVHISAHDSVGEMGGRQSDSWARGRKNKQHKVRLAVESICASHWLRL